MRKLNVYIHIPFCAKKCLYCDFLSFSAGDGTKTAYMEALLREIEKEACRYEKYVVDTVFFGGGTPSAVEGIWIEKILCKLHERFAFSLEPEITVEVNPGSADEEKLKGYKMAGVNRISIGAQSVREEELRLLGRVHDAGMFYETFRLARKTGFGNINVDLMEAVPGQSSASLMETLKAVTDLRPEHISAYSLIIEEGTFFYGLYGEKGKRPPDMPALPCEEEERDMDHMTQRFLEEKGYVRYEISNYALPGACCRHNTACWRRLDYVGFGLGAASMVENVRFKNTEDMESYVNFFLTKGSKKGEEESSGGIKKEIQALGEQEQMEEFMFLGLRLTEGVSRAEFARSFGRTMDEVYGETLSGLYGNGLLTGQEQVRLTPYGRDISNYVMAQFLF